MPIALNDDEAYQLFITLDNYARQVCGTDKAGMEWRERFLPFYRDWHAAHPHQVHPSARAAAESIRDGRHD